MGLISGAVVGLLYAVGTGKSKAKCAALGAAVGLGAKVVWDMTPMGQQAKRDAAAQLAAIRTRLDAARSGRTGVAGMGETARQLSRPEWVWS
jgi:hypothetical protein